MESCIDNEIGFVFTPVFSKSAMDALKDTSDDLQQENSNSDADENVKLIVDKQISANDIRARILRLPKAIIDLLPEEAQKVKVVFNGLAPKYFPIKT